MTHDESDAIRHGSHSGQWGLASIALSSLVILFFPMFMFLFLALLLGAWNIPEVERRHIEFSITGLNVTVFSILGVSLFALLCALMGLVRGIGRGQPLGLSLAGLVTSLVAVAVSAILIGTAHFAIEDAHRLLREHTRFIPASPELIKEVKEEVEKQPYLKPMYDKAMADGVMTEYEANQILIRAGTRVVIPRQMPW